LKNIIYILSYALGDMLKVPEDLKYTKTHEWFRSDGKTVTVGITDYAQHQLTDIVYVDFPKPGSQLIAGKPMLTIESVKSAEDVFSPATGEIVEVNQAVASKPEILNQDPYTNWLVKIRLSGNSMTQSLSPAEYRELTAEN
jgi:glycine cleavage system H protein